MRTSRSASRGGLNARIDRAPRGGVSTNASANAATTPHATRKTARNLLIESRDYSYGRTGNSGFGTWGRGDMGTWLGTGARGNLDPTQRFSPQVPSPHSVPQSGDAFPQCVR